MGKIKKFKKRMDYTEEGGAVLMGISKPVIRLTEALTPRLFIMLSDRLKIVLTAVLRKPSLNHKKVNRGKVIWKI